VRIDEGVQLVGDGGFACRGDAAVGVHPRRPACGDVQGAGACAGVDGVPLDRLPHCPESGVGSSRRMTGMAEPVEENLEIRVRSVEARSLRFGNDRR